MKEMKRKKCPDIVRIAQVSLYLELEPQEENVVLEALDISSSRPLQWVDIPANSSHVFLSGLPPDKLFNVTLKLARGTDPLSLEHYLSKTVFTGGCVPPTSSNFTRTLLDFFFPTKSSGGCALTRGSALFLCLLGALVSAQSRAYGDGQNKEKKLAISKQTERIIFRFPYSGPQYIL